MLIKKTSVSVGIFWIEIPQANVFMLCGCPADAVKHLKKRGLIESVEKRIGVKKYYFLRNRTKLYSTFRSINAKR